MIFSLDYLYAHYYPLLIVTVGTTLIGTTAGGIGVFTLWRKQSLLGDAISHAALPGIALMFLITGSTHPFVLLLGGWLAGLLGALFIAFLAHVTTIKRDALLGIILSVFFGFGLVLRSLIQTYELEHQAILGKFFFGASATLLPIDLFFFVLISVTVLAMMYYFYKEFVLITFDRSYAATQGYKVFILDLMLTLLTVSAIIIGLHAVGVLLMSAMLIGPAAAARQWTHRLDYTLFLACVFGALSSFLGSVASYCVAHLPTGPVIVVISSCIVFISLWCGPHKSRGE